MHAYPLDTYALRLYLGRRFARLRRTGRALARALHRACAAMQRFNEDQRWAAARQMSADGSMFQPNTAPADYSEFLFRTSGPLMHEPPASARLSGHGVR